MPRVCLEGMHYLVLKKEERREGKEGGSREGRKGETVRGTKGGREKERKRKRKKGNCINILEVFKMHFVFKTVLVILAIIRNKPPQILIP